MSTSTGSFIKSDILKDIRGRSRFVCTTLEEHLARHADPDVPTTPALYSGMDADCIAMYGVDTTEVRIILEETFTQSFGNPTVESKLKELLALTKLQAGDSLSQKLKKHRASVEARRQDILRRDTAYQSKLKSAAAKRASIQKSWENVAGQVRTRWKSILKSLSVALSRYEFFVDLNPRDQYAIRVLADHHPNACAIVRGRVAVFDIDKLIYADFGLVQEIVNTILTGEELDIDPALVSAISHSSFSVKAA